MADSGAASLHEAAAAWTAAANARDAEAMAIFFAPEVIAMYPQPAPTVGREANREAWARFFRRPNATHPLTTDTLVLAASGDLAYTLGRWAVNYEGPGGPVAAGGRYLAVWRPVDGAWRIVALSANTHQPAPAITAAPR
ncbi:MAG: DUF4440 domain-containing protein [Chloroflexota bacterium]|nr:DUF4440 domain-containing protein [Chloroflexota bacterium]